MAQRITKLKKGDNVYIRSGKDKGKSGKIISVNPKTGTVVVEGLNMHKRFQKKSGNKAGQQISFPGSMPASKVMLMDPDTNKPTRVGFKVNENGTKQRLAKKSGKVI